MQVISTAIEHGSTVREATMLSHLEAASTLLDQGDAESALRMLRNSWEPDLPAAMRIPLYSMWIRCLCELSDLDHALCLSQRAAQEFPQDPDILTALGNVHDLRDELEDAHRAFELAVQLQGGVPVQHYNLGTVLERLGQEAEAEQEFRNALEVEDGTPPMPEATAALGALWRRRGEIARACELYERHLDEDPLDVDILIEHGICLSDLDRYEDACDRYASAVMLAPDHAGAWYNYGVTLFRMGKLDEARDAMDRALGLEPENMLTAAVLGSWLLSIGGMHLDRGLELTYRATTRIQSLVDRGEIDLYYACLVIEEAFEGLWASGRSKEARQLAYEAGRRDIITTHIFDTLNRADRGAGAGSKTFVVSARARIVEDFRLSGQPGYSPEIPASWPVGSDGYLTQLSVIAADEGQARSLTVEYLARLEPETQLHFDLKVRRETHNEELDPRLAARGVVRVNSVRDYFPTPLVSALSPQHGQVPVANAANGEPVNEHESGHELSHELSHDLIRAGQQDSVLDPTCESSNPSSAPSSPSAEAKDTKTPETSGDAPGANTNGLDAGAGLSGEAGEAPSRVRLT